MTDNNCKKDYVPGHSSAVKVIKSEMLTSAVVSRFCSHIGRLTENGCLLWSGRPNNAGYGHICIEGKHYLVHRIAWSMANFGQQTPALLRHVCDNRRCINPSHLISGTPADNMKDKVARNRQSRQKGSQHGCAKLCEKDVTRIKEILIASHGRLGLKIIADVFGVSKATICNIGREKSWTHVTIKPQRVEWLQANGSADDMLKQMALEK